MLTLHNITRVSGRRGGYSVRGRLQPQERETSERRAVQQHYPTQLIDNRRVQRNVRVQETEKEGSGA